MRVVAAADKFRGSASATEVVHAVRDGLAPLGIEVDTCPLADGGEGTLEALGGANRVTTVSDPLGEPVEAAWRLAGREAVIEMARASGLDLVGGPEHNDAVAASTYGTGELVAAAVDDGARRVIVGVGGSATTDGGLGALRAMSPLARYRGVEIVVACDVRTAFLDAATVFAPQKGASPAQVELLRRRLERLADVYEGDYGRDVRSLARSGAAGGLAGGLAAIGAHLVDGFELVADEVGFGDRLETADLVVTGEGALDAQSFEGKVVGGVVEWARSAGLPVLVVVGQVAADLEHPLLDDAVTVVSLSAAVGAERAWHDTTAAIAEVVNAHVGR